MTVYSEFVKAHYGKVAHLPHKERFKALGEMWKKQKGGGLISDIAHGVGSAADMFGLGLKLEKKKRARKEKGGVLSAGALPEKPKRMRKAKGGVLSAGELDTGAGLISSALGMLGL